MFPTAESRGKAVERKIRGMFIMKSELQDKLQITKHLRRHKSNYKVKLHFSY